MLSVTWGEGWAGCAQEVMLPGEGIEYRDFRIDMILDQCQQCEEKRLHTLEEQFNGVTNGINTHRRCQTKIVNAIPMHAKIYIPLQNNVFSPKKKLLPGVP